MTRVNRCFELLGNIIFVINFINKRFSKLPKEVRLALFDMIFNLGQTKLKKYRKFNASITKKDWLTAAKESRRRIDKNRDKYVNKLFINAHSKTKSQKNNVP